MLLNLLIALCFMLMTLTLFGLLINRSNFSDVLKWLLSAPFFPIRFRNNVIYVDIPPDPAQRCLRVQQGGALGDDQQKSVPPPRSLTEQASSSIPSNIYSDQVYATRTLVVLGLPLASHVSEVGAAKVFANMCAAKMSFRLSIKDIKIEDKKLVAGGRRWMLLVTLPLPVAAALMKAKSKLRAHPTYTIDRPRPAPELKRRYFFRRVLRLGASLTPPHDLSFPEPPPPPPVGSPTTPAPTLAPPPSPPSALPTVYEIVSNPVPGRDREHAIRITKEMEHPVTKVRSFMVEFVGREGEEFECHSVSKPLKAEWYANNPPSSSVRLPPPPPPPSPPKKRGRPKKKSVTFGQSIGAATAPDPTSAQRQAAAPSTELDSSVRRAADLGAEQEAGPSGIRQSRRAKQLAPLYSGIKGKKK